MKYKYKYMSMTQLGKLFFKDNKSLEHASSHDIGRWLIAVGLRDGNRAPSQKAIEEGFVFQRYCGKDDDILNSYWKADKTVEELEKHGYKRLPNPSESLVQHENLDGPFTYARNCHNGYDIKSSHGDVSITVYGQQNAHKVTEAMNIYDRCTKKKANGAMP